MCKKLERNRVCSNLLGLVYHVVLFENLRTHGTVNGFYVHLTSFWWIKWKAVVEKHKKSRRRKTFQVKTTRQRHRKQKKWRLRLNKTLRNNKRQNYLFHLNPGHARLLLFFFTRRHFNRIVVYVKKIIIIIKGGSNPGTRVNVVRSDQVCGRWKQTTRNETRNAKKRGE